MAHTLYDPFNDFRFDNNTCFLSGQPLSSADDRVSVFPRWLMHKYALEDKPFKLLDDSIRTYKQLQLPCAAAVAGKIYELDEQTEKAFSVGYAAVKELSQVTLFQWVGRMVYGVIVNEIQAGIRQQAISGEPMNFSQVLAHKFKNLHLMLQSLIVPMEFEGALPFTVVVVPVENPKETFNYRDEINTLVYSLQINDIGLIVCLQDNGTNKVYHKEYLEKLHGRVLHPVQFEELCARFFYSAYLFNRLPEYTVMSTDDSIYVEPMPLADMSMKPIFDHWQVKTFGQVLENFWAPWGLTLFEIIKNPEHPISFLLDAEGHPLPAEAINLSKG
ncbi:hypothetical protein SAMN05421747_1091 [Parapedobacter composti]|uniref:Uncharacterized protein n=1 Tax=Parapedobacter composti TaxID=623281 RepID=A0A1I1ID96_9SPHI|nr:hypothetical protein [Parapedobacter composti]SFC34194.1 hypothetical protein SAMN05421747_1091 [Parapedobacter composti]